MRPWIPLALTWTGLTLAIVGLIFAVMRWHVLMLATLPVGASLLFLAVLLMCALPPRTRRKP